MRLLWWLCKSYFILQLTSLSYSMSRYIPAKQKLLELVLGLIELSQLATQKAPSKAVVKGL